MCRFEFVIEPPSQSHRTVLPMAVAGLLLFAVAISQTSAEPALPWREDLPRVDLYGDPLPPGAIARLGTVRLRQPPMCRYATFSPDGAEVAAAARATNIHFWDTATGEERAVLQLPDPSATINSLSYSPDGRWLAAGIKGGVMLYDAKNRQEHRRIKLQRPDDRTREIYFARQGQWLLFDEQDADRICLFDLEAGRELRTFRRGQFWSYCAARQLLLRVDSKGKVYECGLDKNDPWADVIPAWRESPLRYADFCPNGNLLAEDWQLDAKLLEPRAHELRITNIATGHRAWTHAYDPTISGLYAVSFSPDARFLAVGNGESVHVWDWQIDRRVADVRGTGARFDQEGKRLVCQTGCGLHLYDCRTWKAPFTDMPSEPPHCVAVSPDSAKVASAEYNGNLRLWDANTMRQLWSAADSSEASQILFINQGRALATAHPRSVRFWDVSGTATKRIDTPHFAAMAFSPEERILALAVNENTEPRPAVLLLDAVAGATLAELQWPTGSIGGRDLTPKLVFAPDGDSLIGVRQHYPRQHGSDVVFWNVDIRDEVLRWRLGRGWIQFLENGHVLANNSEVNDDVEKITFYEVATGLACHEISLGRRVGNDVAILSHSPRVLGGTDEAALFWDVVDGTPLPPIELSHPAWNLTAFPDESRCLVSADRGDMVIFPIPESLGGPAPAAKVKTTPEELPSLWNDLGGKSPEAYQAIARMAALSDGAVTFLNERLKAADVDAALALRLIAQLDDDSLAVRAAAREGLVRIGPAVRPYARRAIETRPSPEAEGSLKAILREVSTPRIQDFSELRHVRAIRVLERIGIASARQILEKLAHGAPEARDTRHAAAALRRLAPQ